MGFLGLALPFSLSSAFAILSISAAAADGCPQKGDEISTDRSDVPPVDADRDVVLLFCDFTNRVVLEREHMAYDVLFVFTRYRKRLQCNPRRGRHHQLCRAR
jgi:hypothetical protein